MELRANLGKTYRSKGGIEIKLLSSQIKKIGNDGFIGNLYGKL